MRYKFCQLARKHQVGIITLKVECSISKAMARNDNRENADRVNPEVIERMVRRFEDAEPDSWEKHFISLCFDETFITEYSFPWKKVIDAWLDPKVSTNTMDNPEELEKQRERTEKDFMHQLDIEFRKVISKAASQWKERRAETRNLNPHDLKSFMDACNGARKQVLAMLRGKTQAFPAMYIGDTSDEALRIEPEALDWRNECDGGRLALRRVFAARFARMLEQMDRTGEPATGQHVPEGSQASGRPELEEPDSAGTGSGG